MLELHVPYFLILQNNNKYEKNTLKRYKTSSNKHTQYSVLPNHQYRCQKETERFATVLEMTKNRKEKLGKAMVKTHCIFLKWPSHSLMIIVTKTLNLKPSLENVDLENFPLFGSIVVLRR